MFIISGGGVNLTKLYHATCAQDRRDNVGTTFGRGAPTKFERAKNVQNLALSLTTFDFECE